MVAVIQLFISMCSICWCYFLKSTAGGQHINRRYRQQGHRGIRSVRSVNLMPVLWSTALSRSFNIIRYSMALTPEWASTQICTWPRFMFTPSEIIVKIMNYIHTRPLFFLYLHESVPQIFALNTKPDFHAWLRSTLLETALWWASFSALFGTANNGVYCIYWRVRFAFKCSQVS